MGEAIYRVPAPKPPVPPDPYLLAWASLRRRRVTMWITLLAWVPMVAVGAEVQAAQTGPLNWLLGSLAMLDWAVLAVSALMATYFRCPHCGELFRNPFWNTDDQADARCCVHCGIRVGTPRSAVVAADPDSTSVDVEGNTPSALRVSIDGDVGQTARGHDEDVDVVESVEDPDDVAGHAPQGRHPR